MTKLLQVQLTRSHLDVAWGFRLHGGKDLNAPLSIQRVFSGSPADGRLQRGDVLKSANGLVIGAASLAQAQNVIKSAESILVLSIEREINQPTSIEEEAAAKLNITTNKSLTGQPCNPNTYSSLYNAYSSPKYHATQLRPGGNNYDGNDGKAASSSQNFYRPAPEQIRVEDNKINPQTMINNDTASHTDAHGQRVANNHHHYPSDHPNAPFKQRTDDHPRYGGGQQQEQYREQQEQYREKEQYREQEQYREHEIQSGYMSDGEPGGRGGDTAGNVRGGGSGLGLEQEGMVCVDESPVKSIREIKQMFNKPDRRGKDDDSVIRAKKYNHRQAQSNFHKFPAAQPPTQHRSGGGKYQPPSPSLPVSALGTPVPKNQPVYQQRSSYNPLEFVGINKQTKPPSTQYRPPGLIQRGAVDEDAVVKSATHKGSNEKANLDPVTDFYLHGLHAKSGVPTFSNVQQHTAPYKGKILPSKNSLSIGAPVDPRLKKKEFHADQSAVYKLLLEEDGPGNGSAKKSAVPHNATNQSSRPNQVQDSYSTHGNKSDLACLLERDQSQLAPYQEHQEHQSSPLPYYSQQIYQTQQQKNHHPQHYQQSSSDPQQIPRQQTSSYDQPKPQQPNQPAHYQQPLHQQYPTNQRSTKEPHQDHQQYHQQQNNQSSYQQYTPQLQRNEYPTERYSSKEAGDTTTPFQQQTIHQSTLILSKPLGRPTDAGAVAGMSWAAPPTSPSRQVTGNQPPFGGSYGSNSVAKVQFRVGASGSPETDF